MKTTQKQIEKTIEHPLESHFNLEPNTTVSTRTERETELIEMTSYDEKDVELEQTYQDIHDKALDSYDLLQDELENTEAKYVARLTEVANSMLNTALSAAQSKARLKEHKDKLNLKKTTTKSTSKTTVNNNLVISREDLLEQILKGGSPLPAISRNEPIESEARVIESEIKNNTPDEIIGNDK